MFNSIKQRFQDMRTITALCTRAEKIANEDGQTLPGAEHFILSALELPDGTACKVFERIQTDPTGFRIAIKQQYDDALQSIGIKLPPDTMNSVVAIPVTSGAGLYKTQPSAQALMQILTKEIMINERKKNPESQLLGAHVILAATVAKYSVTMRAFRAMGIDSTKLAEASRSEIIAHLET